jgi:hypothetical protein
MPTEHHHEIPLPHNPLIEERAMANITVVVDEDTQPRSGTLGGSVLGSSGRRVQELGVETLKASLGALSGQLGDIFSGIRQVGDASLKEIQVSVEINAEGGVSLIGTAKSGISGAITLKFQL